MKWMLALLLLIINATSPPRLVDPGERFRLAQLREFDANPRLTGADYDELIVSGAPVDRGPCISLYGATVILLDGGDPESLGHGCMPLYEWDEAERVCVLHITVNAPCVGPERPPHEVRFDVSCAGEPESAVYYVSECEEAK